MALNVIPTIKNCKTMMFSKIFTMDFHFFVLSCPYSITKMSKNRVFWIFGQIQYVLYVRITHYLRWNMYSKCISSQIFPKLIRDVVLGNRKLDLIWKSKVFNLLRTIVNLYREFSQLPPLKMLKMQP